MTEGFSAQRSVFAYPSMGFGFAALVPSDLPIQPDSAMARQRPLLLLLFVVLVVSTHLSRAQHWSHGWYPGGKRELDLSQTPELVGGSERYRQYRLVLQALRLEFKQEVLRKQHEERLDRESGEEVMEEHRKLMAWNNAENERLRKKREERLRREEEELQDHKLQGALNHARLMEDFLKQKEREVLQLQEEARNFITPENLDERIEECLDNPRNYNFAIDKEGRIVKQSMLS
ncbi:28S ribosomal protein S26 [Chelonia mydas]|uniref:Small ribosomal subunit protein mS26 n=1 Tax=Chelonia mydas TaxID=8469 RepID=M7BL04_CHEMY|nr:28S ribosomal protein S26 [Chelonia mydas]